MRQIMIALLLCLSFLHAAEPAKPNVVVILCDDLGYGDVGCYGATKVKTPNIDRAANDGLRFTNAYAPSATCTPTRYALLTGEYAWRKKGTGILPGDAALIIQPGRVTTPSILKQSGYATGCVGKWHLGLGASGSKLDWNTEISPGPNEIGFDYSFIIPATADRVPCVFVENRRVVGLEANDPITVSYKNPVGDEPTGAKNPELLKMKLSHGHDNTIINGISRIGWMSGGKAARWTDETIAEVITKKATDFIEQNKDKPFFLYFATHDIHVPRAPGPKFAGSSQCGIRGDVIQQFDWSVGEVLATLDKLKLSDNTLVIITSDNGPVVDDGYADGAVEKLNGHTPAGPLRGGKYSIFEGGTRVPFITRWVGKIKPGISEALVSQVDFLCSFAALAGEKVPSDAGPDSLNVLSAILGSDAKGRDHLIEHANGIAIRKGHWKFIPAGPKAAPQLYDLSTDVAEAKNVAGDHAEIVKELSAQLEKIRDSGRTRAAD